MYTSRDRTGVGLRHSTSPCCFPSPTRCYSVCRSPSPSVRRTTCDGFCDCPASLPNCTRKSVRFDYRNPRLGRSVSVGRGRHGSYTDCSSIYRASSPTLLSRPKSVLDDTKTMEYANLNVLLRRLSILQLEMNGLLNGKSLKERVQMIGHKLDDDINPPNFNRTPSKPPLKCVHHLQSCTRAQPRTHHVLPTFSVDTCKWRSPSFLTKEREDPPLFCPKHEPPPSREPLEQSQLPLTQESDSSAGTFVAPQNDPDWKESKQMVQLWRDYNCDLHLRRIIDGSRKDAAYRILEKIIHCRLTYHMLQYIGAVAKGLMGDEKTHYLSFFKREGPFKSKPLNEGTYCELLSFVDQQVNLAKDVSKALEVSEEGLEEEGVRGGYDPDAIGDIRAQMRVFLSVVSSASAPSLSNPALVSQAEDEDTIFTRAFLHDLIKASDQGKLGGLQPAHKLIKLACFLVLKRME